MTRHYFMLALLALLIYAASTPNDNFVSAAQQPAAATQTASAAQAKGWAWVYQSNPNGKEERLADALPTRDDGYLVFGETSSFGAGQTDLWVLKLNASGASTWQRTYGGAGAEKARKALALPDGGYLLIATTESFGAGQADAWLLKLAEDGHVEWQKTYGGALADAPHDALPLGKGQLLVAGSTSYIIPAQPPPAGKKKGTKEKRCTAAWVAKLNADGSIVWQRQFRYEQDKDAASYRAQALALAAADDNNYLVTGDANGRGFLLKLNEDGLPVANANEGGADWSYWYDAGTETYGSGDCAYSGQDNCYETSVTEPFNTEVRGVFPNRNGYFLIGGRRRASAAAWLAQTDLNGKVVWAKKLDKETDANHSRALSFTRLADGGYVLTALAAKNSFKSLAQYGRDIALLKVDETGAGVWKKIIKSPDVDTLIHQSPTMVMRPLAGGDYLFARDILNQGTWKNLFWSKKTTDKRGGLLVMRLSEQQQAGDCLISSDDDVTLRPTQLTRATLKFVVSPTDYEAKPSAAIVKETNVAPAPACH